MSAARPLPRGGVVVLVATVIALLALLAAPSSGAGSAPGAATTQALTQTVTTACNNTFSPTKFPLDYKITSTPSVSPVPAGTSFTVNFDVTAILAASFLNGVYGALGGPLEIAIPTNKVTIAALSGATGPEVQRTMASPFVIPAPAAIPVATGVEVPLGTVTGTYTAGASGSAVFTIVGNSWAPGDTLPSGVTEAGWTGAGGGATLTSSGQKTFVQSSLLGGVIKPYLVCMGGTWTVSGGATPTYGPPLLAPAGFGAVPISTEAPPTAPECSPTSVSVGAGASVLAVSPGTCTDVNGDFTPSATSVVVASPPTSGTALVGADGGITYTNTDKTATTDSFTFTATDSGGLTSSPVTATVTITPPVAPTCTSPVAVSATAGSTATIDPVPCSGDGFTPSATSVAVAANPASGTASVGATGAITYTNTDTEATSDSFTFTATNADGLTSTPATVNVTVNPPTGPICTSPVALSVDNGGSATLDPVPCTGDGFTPSADSVKIASAPTKGTAAVGADGAITYTNTDTAATADSFTFTATNAAGATSTATVNVTIAPPAFITGKATYPATPCTVDLTGDVVPIDFVVEGTVPSAVESGDTITITDQTWSVMVPGALLDQVGPLLGGGSSFDAAFTPSVNGTNTDPANAVASPVTVAVGPIGAPPNPDLTTSFPVGDIAVQAIGGDAAFQMGPTTMVVPLPGGLVVSLACAPSALPEPWLQVTVTGAPLPPKPTAPAPTPTAAVLDTTATQTDGTTGTLPYTGSDSRSLAIQILTGLLLLQIGYVLWSATRPVPSKRWGRR